MVKAFVLIVSLLLVKEARGSGYVDVQAVSFVNEYGKDRNGANCDFWPADYCDHKFTFCLVSGGSCTTTFHTGTYWDLFYVDFGNPMAGGVANPMRFHFPDSYPGQFTIRTVIIDDDGGSSADDAVDTVTITRTMSPGQDSTVRQAGVRLSYTVFLTLSFSVRCDTNFYGESCNVYCEPTDSESGHYTCGPSGERVCLEGWTNPAQHCLTAICDPECVFGTCTLPDTCSCDTGYTGGVCDIAICQDGCQYGNCSVPNTCICYPGYSGSSCEVDERFCERQNPCTNGGTCMDTGPNQYMCNCPYGYNGTNCNSTYEVCSVPDFCANGGSCTSGGGVGQFECTCPSGYTGERCEELVDNCVSGVCLNGGECVNAHNSFSCRCAEGFTGELCDAEVDHCSPNSCQNDGVCIDIGLDYECVCPVTVDGSESGKNCEGSPCLYHKCENNGTCSVDSSAKAVCACVGAFVGPHCEYVVVNDAVSENDVPLIAGVSAGVGIPLILLVICVPLVAVCVCCRIRRRKKERPESPDRSEQYAVYYDTGEEKVDHCPEKMTTLNYTNQGLDVSDESEDEADYSTVGHSPLPGVPSTQAYDTLQHIQYSNSGFGGRPKTGTSLDRNGYSVPSRTSTASSRTSTFQGRVSPPPNYTDLPSPLRRTFGGGGSGLPVPEVVEENPYDTPPSVQFVRSEL